ncbi:MULTISPECIES: YchJ family protein [Burkholderia]|uniref:YchJ family protein n=1 Tax=Burkholderia sola TaxID=2843302 RepID=A0ABV2CBX0_9BURK|nr:MULTISPECIES: YchJ family protein [unclassified Burkholderia]MBP0608613.1 YchJ family protein [Burkholderia sp. CpTa8-5]MBP0716380.1 YchJ family protein [Burkholderia sp. AcTa6-5]
MISNRPDACPCGGASPAPAGNAPAPRYAACCGRFIDGAEAAPTALELMRSRYSAYVLGATDYLRATWAARTCPPDLDTDPDAPDAPRWLGLAVKRHVPLDDRHAEVEFVARYKVGGRAYRLHETSRFERDEQGFWRYVDGEVSER